MSTKRIERTVIEGGRNGYYKNIVKKSKRQLRARMRDYLNDVKKDLDIWDEEIVPCETYLEGYRSEYFKDKLSPVKRFAEKADGRHWNDVYSEIRSKFDTRTTPGRHIVFDHLLHEFGFEERDDYGRLGNVIVDLEGNCAKHEGKRYHYQNNWPDYQDWFYAANFLGNRKVRQVGIKYYWLVQSNSDFNYRIARFERGELVYASDDEWQLINKTSIRYRHPCRQDKELTKEELDNFFLIHQKIRDIILK